MPHQTTWELAQVAWSTAINQSSYPYYVVCSEHLADTVICMIPHATRTEPCSRGVQRLKIEQHAGIQGLRPSNTEVPLSELLAMLSAKLKHMDPMQPHKASYCQSSKLRTGKP